MYCVVLYIPLQYNTQLEFIITKLKGLVKKLVFSMNSSYLRIIQFWETLETDKQFEDRVNQVQQYNKCI